MIDLFCEPRFSMHDRVNDKRQAVQDAAELVSPAHDAARLSMLSVELLW